MDFNLKSPKKILSNLEGCYLFLTSEILNGNFFLLEQSYQDEVISFTTPPVLF